MLATTPELFRDFEHELASLHFAPLSCVINGTDKSQSRVGRTCGGGSLRHVQLVFVVCYIEKLVRDFRETERERARANEFNLAVVFEDSKLFFSLEASNTHTHTHRVSGGKHFSIIKIQPS